MEQYTKPILFIVFNRLDTTQKVFEQIKKVRPLKLYIASDGPRNKEEEKKVLEIRNYLLENIDWPCELKTRFRTENLGVGFGPNDAITWFFSQEEMGLIIEDDCLPSLSFFSFCDLMLDYYKNDKRIGVIQGFNPFPKEMNNSYFFSTYDLKWGWATWKDRWVYQDMYTKDWPEVKKNKLLDDKFQNKKLVTRYWYNMFEQIHRSPYMAWDTQFTYQMLKRNIFTIVPLKNIVMNIGYRDDATSTRWGMPEHIRQLTLEELNFPIKHPENIKPNKEYDELVEKVHFEINLKTVLRYELRNLLDSNKITRKLLLSPLIFLYRYIKILEK